MDNREKWELLYKVYGIIAFQFLLAIAVGSLAVSFPKVSHFVRHTAPGLSIYIISAVLYMISGWIIVQSSCTCSPCFCLWSILFAFVFGFYCSYPDVSAKVLLEALILGAVVAAVLTIYSYRSASEYSDFSQCKLLSISIFVVACLYIPIQIFHPFAKLSQSLYACAVIVVFFARTSVGGTFFFSYPIRDPVRAAAFCHCFFLVNNPDREDVTDPSRFSRYLLVEER